MREFCISYRGRSDAGKVTLSVEVIRVIRIFRFLFVMVALRKEVFSRSFESFESRQPTYVCEYDASL